MKNLQARLGHCFKDASLLERALTHRSVGAENYERLEFLGDAVLGMVIAEQLFRLDKGHEEGDLSRLRASLVNRDSLAEIAGTLELGEVLRLGSGELKSGGFRRASILADVLESLIGAIYLDAGYPAARDFILRIYSERLAGLPDPETLKDPKTRLQELLQARQLALPEYSVTDTSGPPHKRRFRVQCRVPVLDQDFHAEGSSRRAAEQAAAEAALKELTNA